MTLSGQLSDLSLAELIEFFCNQRKTGRLKVAYERAPGYFYFDRGDLVDARIASLNGIEAIYYALTLANASFKFSPAFEATRRSIHQPWTRVTLEGLRRLDEGIKPKEPVVEEGLLNSEDPDVMREAEVAAESDVNAPLPLALTVDHVESGGRRKMVFAGVALALIALVAVAGVPAGWYRKGDTAVQTQPVTPPSTDKESVASSESSEGQSPAEQPAYASEGLEAGTTNDANVHAARRAREARDRARAVEASAARSTAIDSPAPAVRVETAKKPDAVKPGPKLVSVQVSYDEAGRVTQTSGGDGTAQRIARQKRFPAGKAGTTTVTIPIN